MLSALQRAIARASCAPTYLLQRMSMSQMDTKTGQLMMDLMKWFFLSRYICAWLTAGMTLAVAATASMCITNHNASCQNRPRHHTNTYQHRLCRLVLLTPGVAEADRPRVVLRQRCLQPCPGRLKLSRTPVLYKSVALGSSTPRIQFESRQSIFDSRTARLVPPAACRLTLRRIAVPCKDRQSVKGHSSTIHHRQLADCL